MHLRSYRSEEGLEAELQIDEKFCSFPGVVSSGAISTLLDCHGNWTAAVTLMDEACLPRPPLTVTYNMNLTYRQPTPPNTPLLIRAKVRTQTFPHPTACPGLVHNPLQLSVERPVMFISQIQLLYRHCAGLADRPCAQARKGVLLHATQWLDGETEVSEAEVLCRRSTSAGRRACRRRFHWRYKWNCTASFPAPQQTTPRMDSLCPATAGTA